MQETIADLIRNALGVEVPAHDTDLVESGLIDSLALVSLITEIERAFGFPLPLEEFELERFSSVDRIAEFVEATRPQSGAA